MSRLPSGAGPRSCTMQRMHHSVSLINTVAAGLGLALVLGFLAARLRLPALVGYLLAGVIIGPFTPGFVADASIAGPAGRDRRDAADVRRRPALLARRPAGGAQDRAARRGGADGGGDAAGRRAGHLVGLEPGRARWCSAWRCRWPARWCCCARSRAWACSIRSTAASRSAGWWSRTWRWCWCWCCCRRWPACWAARRAAPTRRRSGRRWASRCCRSAASSC